METLRTEVKGKKMLKRKRSRKKVPIKENAEEESAKGESGDVVATYTRKQLVQKIFNAVNLAQKLASESDPAMVVDTKVCQMMYEAVMATLWDRKLDRKTEALYVRSKAKKARKVKRAT